MKIQILAHIYCWNLCWEQITNNKQHILSLHKIAFSSFTPQTDQKQETVSSASQAWIHHFGYPCIHTPGYPSLDTPLYHQEMHFQTVWPLPPLSNLSEFCPHNKSRIWSFSWWVLCWCSADEYNTLYAELLNTLQNSRVCLLLLPTRKEKSLCHRQRWIELNSNKYQIYQITE